MTKNEHWQLEFTGKAIKQLKKLNQSLRTSLLEYLEAYVVKINSNNINPKSDLKPLLGNKQGLYRLRCGDYRIIIEINDKKLVLLALSIGHRKDIYRS